MSYVTRERGVKLVIGGSDINGATRLVSTHLASTVSFQLPFSYKPCVARADQLKAPSLFR